ncbi:unnamed protein product [Rhizophagus irregularis]|nr:unnamed protein product [Rhizophagus irregularis]
MVKETLYEFKLQHTVNFHDNIRLYGITNLEIQNKKLNSYMIVMDYANGAYAVSTMHEAGIVHCGLHSKKVVGVLLWIISSGDTPFNTNGEYDIGLAIEISQGLRESIISETPSDYAKLYTECWDVEPDKRPSMQEVKLELQQLQHHHQLHQMNQL